MLSLISPHFTNKKDPKSTVRDFNVPPGLGLRGTFPVSGFWKKKAGLPIFAGIRYILLYAKTYRGHFNLRADAPRRACRLLSRIGKNEFHK